MAKKLNITPVSSDNVCVPSDILGHCEEIYSKFEKDVKKYAPGNLAFFKFNSTIVDNLKTLKENTGNSLYIVAVYQSYFKNCKGLDKIEKITKKILNKLDSLLESIGSGKDASISTKGLKGLFSKKRSRNKDFENLYNYFLEIKTKMQTTIDDNKINTKFLPTNFKFKILRQTSGAHPDDLSGNISKMTTQKELQKCLDSRKLEFFLESVDVSALQDNAIPPSYGEVVSKFLEDAQIEYTNFYKIQHQFKKLYDVKGEVGENDPQPLKEMKIKYSSLQTKLKEREEDLELSFQCLEELSKNFNGRWSEEIKDSLKDILEIQKNISKLSEKVKDDTKSFRSSIFSNEDTDDTNSYESMIRSISISMEVTLDNILQSQANISSTREYNITREKLESLNNDFENCKYSIDNCIKKAALKDLENDKNGLAKATRKYDELYKSTEKKSKEIINKINGLSTKQVKYIINLIGKEEAEKSFNKLKSLTGYIGTALGVSISIAGAIIGCYQKAKTI